MDEIKKSISSILYERTTSPFFGTFIFSWLIWNWKIPYLTFFISENKIDSNKVDYIVKNYSNVNHLLTLPLISTIILLTIFPFISNGAYWLSLKFDNWKINQKNKIEDKQLLTVEQSIELREQIRKQEERFINLLSDKNSEIESLRNQIAEVSSQSISLNESDENEIRRVAERIQSNESEMETFDYIRKCIHGNLRMDTSPEVIRMISLLESHDLIYKPEALYKFTDNGRKLLKYISE